MGDGHHFSFVVGHTGRVGWGAQHEGKVHLQLREGTAHTVYIQDRQAWEGRGGEGRGGKDRRGRGGGENKQLLSYLSHNVETCMLARPTTKWRSEQTLPLQQLATEMVCVCVCVCV